MSHIATAPHRRTTKSFLPFYPHDTIEASLEEYNDLPHDDPEHSRGHGGWSEREQRMSHGGEMEYQNSMDDIGQREHRNMDYAMPVDYSTAQLGRNSYQGSYQTVSSIPANEGRRYRYGTGPEPRLEPDQEPPNYKPSALRWPFLTFLIAALLGLIGVVAYALHALPVVDDNLDILARGLHHKRDPGLRGRQETSSSTEQETSISEFIPDSVTSDPGATMTVNSDNYGDVGSITVTIASSKASDDYGNVGSVTITNPGEQTTAEAEATEDYGNVGSVTITDLGEQTVTADPSNLAPEYHGDVGSKTVTVPVTADPSKHGTVGAVDITETLTQDQAPTFVTPSAVILTDAEGKPTATSTSTPAPVSTPRKTTLTDSLGQATATQTTLAQVEPSITIQTDENGNPTATVTSYPTIPTGSNVVLTTHYISYGSYFIGMFLPTLIAILLAVPVRILDLNAKNFQPWHELTHAAGASGADSLCLQTGGWQSVVTSVRVLFGRGQPLVFLTTVLTLASALLIPLAAEAVAFDLAGSCKKGGGDAGHNCAYVLSVFRQAAWVTLGLLAVMVIAALLAVMTLRRWRSGVATNPWSICGTAALALSPEIRRLFTGLPAGIDAAKMPKHILESVLDERNFKLGYFYNADGAVEYGVILYERNLSDDDSLHKGAAPVDGMVVGGKHHGKPIRTKRHLPFLMLGYAGRLSLLFVLCGLLVLILYYNNTGGDTPFERFMDSESFGVRFLFTGVGVVISFFWASFFNSIAIISPYQLLSDRPQLARHSILLAPPTNAVSGLRSAIRRRHGFLAVVAVTSLLSEVLTIFLTNIPFRVTQTFLVHTICTWSAVGILFIMVLVVLGSFCVTWPHMPLDPSTVAGAMYYVCDSWMLGQFEGLSVMRRPERDARVRSLGARYEFGEMGGVEGTRRIGVDSSDERSWTL